MPIGFHFLDETSQHFLDLNGRLIEFRVFFDGKKPEVLGEQEMVLEFAGRSGGDVQEALELGITSFAAALGKIRAQSKPNIDESGW